MLPEAAAEQYRAQQRLVTSTLALTRGAWARMDFGDIDGSFARVLPVLVSTITSAQVGAARNAAAFVPAALTEQGQLVAAQGQVNPTAFAGWSSDGRTLDGLLVGAKVHAKAAQSLEVGGRWLAMVAQTLVADAARQASQVDMFARPRVGYVRAVNPPCCKRCAPLAGKFSRSDVAFRRHPRCDCFNVPTQEGATHPGVTIGPDDVRDLTKPQRQAIADGADMNQVINSDRGRAKNGLTTTEGTSRRGIAGRALRGRQRLTPEGIYRIASDRTEALRLLGQHGYLL